MSTRCPVWPGIATNDDSGDGLIVTSIHGRNEARTYAKGVTRGSSEQSLSPEEQQAIDLAMRGPGRR